MCVVLLLKPLLSSGVQVVASDCDYIVATVCGGIEDGLVLSHQCYGDLCGDSSEGSLTGANIDMVPGAAVSKAGLLIVSMILLSVERRVLTWPTTWDILRGAAQGRKVVCLSCQSSRA